MKILFIALIITGFIILLIMSFRSGKFFRWSFSSLLQGIGALLAVNVVGMVTGLHLAVNWYTLAFSALFGTPGVICLTMAEFFMGK